MTENKTSSLPAEISAQYGFYSVTEKLPENRLFSYYDRKEVAHSMTF